MSPGPTWNTDRGGPIGGIPDFVDRSRYDTQAEFERANLAAFHAELQRLDPDPMRRLGVPGPVVSGQGRYALWMMNRQGPNYNQKNFSSADLIGADLFQVYAVDATFRGARMDDANFDEACLLRADFSNARLRNASLVRAYLLETKFPHADLSGANLAGANLCGANLAGANLSDADLTQVLHDETTTWP